MTDSHMTCLIHMKDNSFTCDKHTRHITQNKTAAEAATAKYVLYMCIHTSI